MKFLTEEQRARALVCLATAPDEIILSAMVDLKAHNHRVEGTWSNLNAILGDLEAVAAGVPNRVATSAPVPASPTPAAAAPRVNVPFTRASAITRIGTATREFILSQLRMSDSSITGLGAKYVEQLILLRERGEIKFDGEAFYL